MKKKDYGQWEGKNVGLHSFFFVTNPLFIGKIKPPGIGKKLTKNRLPFQNLCSTFWKIKEKSL